MSPLRPHVCVCCSLWWLKTSHPGVVPNVHGIYFISTLVYVIYHWRNQGNYEANWCVALRMTDYSPLFWNGWWLQKVTARRPKQTKKNIFTRIPEVFSFLLFYPFNLLTQISIKILTKTKAKLRVRCDEWWMEVHWQKKGRTTTTRRKKSQKTNARGNKRKCISFVMLIGPVWYLSCDFVPWKWLSCVRFFFINHRDHQKAIPCPNNSLSFQLQATKNVQLIAKQQIARKLSH